MNVINVFSEIGRLKRVLVHRPGQEVENLTPELLPTLLFDDIPYLKVAQQEHDVFVKILKDNMVDVVYIEDLISQTLDSNENVKNQFINQFIEESGIYGSDLKRELTTYFLSMPTRKMIDKMIAGVRRDELSFDKESKILTSIVNREFPFLTNPMPNVLFTRDPFATIGNGVSIHHMYSKTRRRETIFGDYVFKYHNDYKNVNKKYYDRDMKFSIEGGDILVLNKNVLAIGITQRTESAGIEQIARNIFEDENNTFEKILAFKIPSTRSFMHLDTVLTQLDYEKFSIHSNIIDVLDVYELTKDNSTEYGLKVTHKGNQVDKILSEALNIKAELISCANGDIIDAPREQWNDGANTLALAPNEVFVYERNHVTNHLFEKRGIKLHVIPSAELSRGRGGPHCMSMPFLREDL